MMQKSVFFVGFVGNALVKKKEGVRGMIFLKNGGQGQSQSQGQGHLQLQQRAALPQLSLALTLTLALALALTPIFQKNHSSYPFFFLNHINQSKIDHLRAIQRLD